VTINKPLKSCLKYGLIISFKLAFLPSPLRTTT
jgi:hypothetical protein